LSLGAGLDGQVTPRPHWHSTPVFITVYLHTYKITVHALFVYNTTDRIRSNSKDSGLCLAEALFKLWQVVVNVAVGQISSPSISALPSVIIPPIQNSHIRSSATDLYNLISDNVMK
jgi:hypothetical protein